MSYPIKLELTRATRIQICGRASLTPGVFLSFKSQSTGCTGSLSQSTSSRFCHKKIQICDNVALTALRGRCCLRARLWSLCRALQ